MAVGMRVHWDQTAGIHAPTTSFYQIPIARHVRSNSNKEIDTKYNTIDLYNNFFNIPDKDLKNFM